MSDEVNNYEDWDINDFEEGKTMAILSYVGFCCCLIGLVPWFMAFSKKDNDFLTFHARQGLGLVLISMVFVIATIILSIILGLVYAPLALLANVLYLPVLGCLGLAVVGILNATKEEFKPVPLIGDMLVEKMSFIGRKEA